MIGCKKWEDKTNENQNMGRDVNKDLEAERKSCKFRKVVEVRKDEINID